MKDVANASQRDSEPEWLAFEVADRRLDGRLDSVFFCEYESVVFFAGDVHVDGDFLAAMTALVDGDLPLIAVAGDLTVEGDIVLYDAWPSLYVGGFTRAHALVAGDCEIHLGDGAIRDVVYGFYNDGFLHAGRIEVPWVLNHGHELILDPVGARWGEDMGENPQADFTRENNLEAFLPEVLERHGDAPPFYDFQAIRKRLAVGKPILRQGNSDRD